MANDKLKFREQWRIVRDGFKKGVKYDGCTGVPDFDFGADCCGEHDYHYQIGDISRAEADRRLRDCILKKGEPKIAWAYWIGVRLLAWRVWNKYRNKEKNEETSVDPGNPPAP